MLLMIDNFDSFSHNLARYFIEVGQDVEIVRNNAITIEEIEALAPTALVISPGPCTPNEAGISLQAIEHFAGRIPIFGVCLGHQAIGQVFGATVVRANTIMHGKVSVITHDDDPLFADIPPSFNVTRYHSLVVANTSWPDVLVPIAWCEENSQRTIMAMKHKHMPIYSVQFHPESLLTEFGHQILANFFTLIEKT